MWDSIQEGLLLGAKLGVAEITKAVILRAARRAWPDLFEHEAEYVIVAETEEEEEDDDDPA